MIFDFMMSITYIALQYIEPFTMFILNQFLKDKIQQMNSRTGQVMTTDN